MKHVKQALHSFFYTTYAHIDVAAQDDFQAFIDCIEIDWELSESELFLIERMLAKDLVHGCIEVATSIQLLIFIRLCAVRNNILERVALLREQMEKQEK